MSCDRTQDIIDDWKCGDTWKRTVIYKDAAKVVIPIVAYTAKMVFRKTYGGADILTLTNVSGIVITALEGRLDITLTDEQTATMSGPFVADLEIISPSGERVHLASWSLTGLRSTLTPA